jgi:hypothetical protein
MARTPVIKIPKKTLKRLFCEAIADNFIIKYSENKLNPPKRIIFIVPTNNDDLKKLYQNYFEAVYKIEMLDDEFFGIRYDNISLLLNVYKMIADKLLHLNDDVDTCFTFLILKYDILKKLVSKLQEQGWDVIVVDAVHGKKMKDRLDPLNITHILI